MNGAPALHTPLVRTITGKPHATEYHPRSQRAQPPVLNTPEAQRMVEVLTARAGVDADPAQVADACVAIWMEIERDLSPILGTRGVAMLYVRSLHLSRVAFPWLAEDADPRTPMDLGALRTRLESRSSAEALAAGHGMLCSFYEVLLSLVGPKLTENLLRTLWTPSSSGPAAQDLSP